MGILYWGVLFYVTNAADHLLLAHLTVLLLDLQHGVNSLFVRCDVCLQAKENNL
jgi:hypothetical protein